MPSRNCWRRTASAWKLFCQIRRPAFSSWTCRCRSGADLCGLGGRVELVDQDIRVYEDLAARASQLGLDRPLFYALRFTSRLLGTPVPGGSSGAATGRPPAPVLALMDRLPPPPPPPRAAL